jgi:hypothetical protein
MNCNRKINISFIVENLVVSMIDCSIMDFAYNMLI